MKDRQKRPDSCDCGDEKSTVAARGRTGEGNGAELFLVHESKERRLRRWTGDKKGGEETGVTPSSARRREEVQKGSDSTH